MNLIARAILRLYPRAWRDRYQAELETLIEDIGQPWAPLPDLLLQGLKMRLTSVNWRFASACAFAGLAIALLISVRQPARFESTALLSVQPGPGDNPAAVSDDSQRLITEARSRTSLSMLMQRPDLNLYAAERRTTPLEDVVQTMRQDLDAVVHADGSIGITYRGSSPAEARATVRALALQLMGQHQRRQRALAYLAGPNPVDPGTAAKLALASRVEIASPPSIPSNPLPTHPWRMAGFGIALGLAVAASIGIIGRNPRVWLAAGIVASLLAIPYGLATEDLFPIFRFRSEATLACDSPETLRAVVDWMAPGGQALSTADGVALRFLNSGRATGLKIEATHHNRFAAQRAAQSAISAMVDRTKVNPAEMDRQKRWLTGPWIEVVDPPSLPINPLGSVWFLGAMRAGVAVSLIAGLTLLYGGVRKRRALANSAA